MLFLVASIIAFSSSAQATVAPLRSTKIIEKRMVKKPITVDLETAIQVLDQKADTGSSLLEENHPMVAAIDKDDAKTIQRWLAIGYSPSARIDNQIKESLLERAAVRGSEKVFDAFVSELELSTEENPKVWRDSRGTPILIVMAALATPEKKSSLKYERMIERLLVDHSDHINDRDRAYIGDGRTALHQAAATGNARLIDILISHGAQVDSENSTGETPLHFAARFGKLSSLKLLIGFGAKIDPKSKHTRSTPLLIASESGHESIIRELLDSGAKKSEKDIFGKTAPQRYKEYVKSYSHKKTSN